MTLASRLALAAGVTAASAFSQSYQTLPQGYDSVEGNSSTQQPQNIAANQTWQWLYDSGEFVADGPIVITDVAIRPKAGFAVNAFNFSSWEVTLGEATTDYADPYAEFGRNLLRATRCRTGPWIRNATLPLPGQTVGGSVWMGLTEPFAYDPTLGNDFVVQIRKCGTNLGWGVEIDAVSEPFGAGVCRRIGRSSSCTQSTANALVLADSAPIVRIEYEPATQTLPAGYGEIEGDASMPGPVATIDDQKWQWVYESTEFLVQRPISITEIFLRPDQNADLAAFSFEEFAVTLATASDNASPPQAQFGQNIQEQECVRSGTWAGGPVAQTPGSPAEWVPIQLDRSFVYDPSSGRDLIIQIEKCGTTTAWNVDLDAASGMVGAVGGDSVANTQSCFALEWDQGTPATDSVPVVRIDFAPVTSLEGAVTRFPWREDFDLEFPRGWANVEGQGFIGWGNWDHVDSPTPTPGTGPNGDHTTGTGSYVYVEDDFNDNDAATLTTPVLDLGTLTTPTLSFWLHSQGAAGVARSCLAVDVMRLPTNTVVADVFTAGHVGPDWTEQTVDLSAFAGESVQILFRVDTNSGNQHDIAIDDVRVYENATPLGQAATPLASLNVHSALSPTGLPVAPFVPGPFFTQVHFGETITLSIEGTPNQPIFLFLGALNVGLASVPGIGQLDVGPDLVPLLSGDVLTDGSGSYSVELPWQSAPGLILPLQAGVGTGGLSILALSNAVVVESL